MRWSPVLFALVLVVGCGGDDAGVVGGGADAVSSDAGGAADVTPGDTQTDSTDTVTKPDEDAEPDPGDATPDPEEDAEPDPGDATPDPGDTTPDPGDTTPDPGDTTPDPGDATPDPEDTTPDPEDTTPDPGDAIPDCDPVDCDDADPCTDDACVEGACVSTPNDVCCATVADCDDLDNCTIDSCLGGLCQHTLTPGCCTTAADCDDADPCTSNTCVAFSCVASPVEGCCVADEECDDANPCTTDACADNACADPASLEDGVSCGDDVICVDGECVDTPVCGDGEQGFGEACDDGDTKPGDGCSMICEVESHEVGDIIFTEFMANPAAVTDAMGEWLEVYNTTDEDVDINGWTLTESNGNPHVITSADPVVVPTGGYLALTLTCDAATNGGIEPGYCYEGGVVDDLVNPGIFLNNDLDEIALGWSDIVIDTLSYDIADDWVLAAGESTQLSANAHDGLSNNAETAWCASLDVFGDGDLGTPGEANVTCP